MDDPFDAILRYEQMTGRVDLDEAHETDAARDRACYGAAYLPRDAAGNVTWDDVRVVRFLVEVCGFSFRESRAAVIDYARAQSVAMADQIPPASVQARTLLALCGDIFEARALAAINRDIVAGSADGAAYWRAVIEALETTRFAPEVAAATYDRMSGSGAI